MHPKFLIEISWFVRNLLGLWTFLGFLGGSNFSCVLSGCLAGKDGTRQFIEMPWMAGCIVSPLGGFDGSLTLSEVMSSLLDDWLRRERFVYVGWSGLLMLPTAYLSRLEVGSPVSPLSHPSTRMR